VADVTGGSPTFPSSSKVGTHSTIHFRCKNTGALHQGSGREFNKTTRTIGTSLNKRFNEQNNGCACAL